MLIWSSKTWYLGLEQGSIVFPTVSWSNVHMPYQAKYIVITSLLTWRLSLSVMKSPLIRSRGNQNSLLCRFLTSTYLGFFVSQTAVHDQDRIEI